MDPFDEFEFKPLTDGLGFHKKSVNLKEGLKKSGVLQDELQSVPSALPKMMTDEAPIAPLKKHSFDDVLSALEKSPLRGDKKNGGLEFTETLPREPNPKAGKKSAMEIETPRAPVNSPFPRPDAYKTPPVTNKKPGSPVPGVVVPEVTLPNSVSSKAAVTAETGTRRGAANSPKGKLAPATVSLESALLDLIIVTGLSLVFMVALLMVTKVDLNIVFKNLNTDIMTQISLGVLFLAVMQMYVVISRSFFGRTLGEWTFDLQMGEDEQQRMEIYPIKIAARSALTTITGLILLPLISALIGRDIAGQITGVKLYRQRIG